MNLPKQLSRLWAGATGQEFELLAVWNPNEEQDPWVRYRDQQELREFTCRLEAFLSRFSPRPD
jgi:hypothetical protein